jgi:hypothetical protein
MTILLDERSINTPSLYQVIFLDTKTGYEIKMGFTKKLSKTILLKNILENRDAIWKYIEKSDDLDKEGDWKYDGKMKIVYLTPRMITFFRLVPRV